MKLGKESVYKWLYRLSCVSFNGCDCLDSYWAICYWCCAKVSRMFWYWTSVMFWFTLLFVFVFIT